MLEKDLENLIAQHPDDFFPGQGLQLIAQQYSIGGKRIDILFQDKSKRNVVIEVKRGILSREASGQIAEYYGLLKSQNVDQFYELIVAANVIPPERKVFLEHIGIECKELGVAQIAEVARKYDYVFSDDVAEDRTSNSASLAERSILTAPDKNASIWIFQANPMRYDVVQALSDNGVGNRLHWLVNRHQEAIKSGHLGIIWMSGKEAGIYALARVESNPGMMREFPEERNYWLEAGEPIEALRVELLILKSLINRPVLRKELKAIPGLQSLSIFKQAQGTNFPVTSEEWRLISSLI